MASTFDSIAKSRFIQLLITLVTYAVYAAVIGVCLAPSIWLVAWGWRTIVQPGFGSGLAAAFGSALGNAPKVPGAGAWVLFGMVVGGALYLYFITGIIVMGAMIRLTNLGIKPGVYPNASPTMLLWLISSGILIITRVTILPMIPMTFFTELFFRIIGCKVGKNVYFNSWILNDANLIDIGDDVVIGGEADISAHIYEKDKLILEPVRIGSGTVIGAHSYISPGVTIGRNCLIGVNSYVRRGKTIPDNSRYTTLAGLPMHEMAGIEKAGATRRRSRKSAGGDAGGVVGNGGGAAESGGGGAP